MLSFAEEIYLLALDDESGKIMVSDRGLVLSSALVGAALGELSFLARVDADAENLLVLDTTPTGRPVLDCVLGELRAAGESRIPLEEAVGGLLDVSSRIEELVLRQLLERKILKEEEGRILWFIPTRRYPIIDNREITDVETRLRELVLDPEALPDPRDAVLVSLVHVCGLFPEILSPKELRRCEARIEQLARMDLVVQQVSRTIIQVHAMMSSVSTMA